MTRYIDADAVIEVQMYDEEHEDFYIEKMTVEDFICRYSEMPSIIDEPHWIPCSERLPEYGDYRESMECLDGCVWYFTDKGLMGLGYYYYSTKEWSTLRDLKPDGKVIAWMPLPKPYKGE